MELAIPDMTSLLDQLTHHQLTWQILLFLDCS